MAYKKKLHRYRPGAEKQVETQHTKQRIKRKSVTPRSLEREVRQLLADKVSGNMVGLWLLVPEHLRLGTWDLLRGWSARGPECIEPRLALQLVHEAALCTNGIRDKRCLSQKGFELTNGLPFVGSDQAIHDLLAEHTVADSQRLQIALGKLRLASGDFRGKLLAVDPHRVRSYSKRQMRRHQKTPDSKPIKVTQTFFALDADTHQPVCFTTATAARSVAQATPELLDMAAAILNSNATGTPTMVLADCEHFSTKLIGHIHQQTHFDLLVPMPGRASLLKRIREIPPEDFTRRWVGYATTKVPYELTGSQTGPVYQLIQRLGEDPEQWGFKAFLSTAHGDELDALTMEYPKRWHIEEFFNANQALGWQRGGTLNLNIRYGQMTMALIAQALIERLRRRLLPPISGWDAHHLATALFQGLDGDVRVNDDTILVTYYNAPDCDRLRQHYENLPDKLRAENVCPRIPWLYDFKLDFRFR